MLRTLTLCVSMHQQIYPRNTNYNVPLRPLQLQQNFVSLSVACNLETQVNCKSKMATSVCTKFQNGYEHFNSKFVLLVYYKFTAFVIKIIFEILK
jgi:hypothetical protein